MKPKFYSMYGTAVSKDGEEHIVTIVGRFTQEKETIVVSENANDVLKLVGVDELAQLKDDAILSVPMTRKVRTLTYAYSICHSDDIFDEEVGVNIAKRRIKSNPLGELKTEMVTSLTKDQINGILFWELNYIIKNIDEFIEKT